MLRQVAGRAIANGTLASTRTTPSARIAARPILSPFISQRFYANDRTKSGPRPPQKPSGKPTNSAKVETTPRKDSNDFSSQQPEVTSDGQRAAATAAAKAGGSGATASDVKAQKEGFSVQQPEFESSASSTQGKNPNIEHAASPDSLERDDAATTSRLRQSSENPESIPRSEDDAAAPSQPRGPLPDLRQGIPSTFEQEFSDRSTSFKDAERDQPNLNLTEDPAAGGGRGRDQDNANQDEYLTSIEKRRLRMARYLYIMAALGGAAGAILLGQNWETQKEADAHPDAPNGWSLTAFYARIKARIGDSLGYYTDPAFDKLLPDQTPDFIPPGTPTLVLSLEDLLVHSKWTRQNGWEVAKRPGVDYFLKYMSQYYELVLFTSVLRMNAEMVILKLDPYHIIQWPLFREATRYVNGQPVKDLSNLNRDLSKTLIIDTVPSHVQLQPENAVVLPKWQGTRQDPNSNDLIAMIPFLEYLATMSSDDYRKVIKSYEGTHIPTEFARREKLARERFNEKLEADRQAGKRRGGGGGFASMLGFKGGMMGGGGAGQPAPGTLPGEQSMDEALKQGKTLADMYRERGQKQYERLDKEIKEQGEKMLQAMEEDNKRAQEEALKGAQDSVKNAWGSFKGVFGFGGDDGNGEGSGKGA